MGTADILVLGFLAFFAVKGLLRGFVYEVIGILGIILAFLCSFMIYTPMLSAAKAIGLRGDTASVTAYVVGFIIIYVLVILIGRLLNKALSLIFLGWLNKLGGFTIGLLKGVILAGIVVTVITTVLPPDAGLVQDIKKSAVASQTQRVVSYMYDAIKDIAGSSRVNPFK